jgi:hypothetical protein
MYNIYIPDLLISTKQLPINEPNFPIKEQFSYVKSHINTDRGLSTKVNMFTVRLYSGKTENE